MLRFRRVTTSIVVLLALWPSLVFGQATRAGIVSTLEGTVTATRVALPQPVPLKFRDEIFLQDRITTGEKSLARLLLGGAAVVTVRERSVLTITEVPGKSTIELGGGKIGLAVARERLRPGDQIEIRTPNAVAGVRGTVVVAEVLHATAQTPPAASAVATRFFVLRGEMSAAGLDQATLAPAGIPQILVRGQSFRRVGFAPPVVGPSPREDEVVEGLQPSQPQHIEAANADLLKEHVMQQTAALVDAITGEQAAFSDPGLLPDPQDLVYLPANEELSGDDFTLSPPAPVRTLMAPTIRFVGPGVTFTEEDLAAFTANAELIVSLPTGQLLLGGNDALAVAEQGVTSQVQATGVLLATASGPSTFLLSTAPSGEPAILTDPLFAPTVLLQGAVVDATGPPSTLPLFVMNTDVVSTGGPLLSATAQSQILSARSLVDLDTTAVLTGVLELSNSTATFTADVVRVTAEGGLLSVAPIVSASQRSTVTVMNGASLLTVQDGLVVGQVLSATDSMLTFAGDVVRVLGADGIVFSEGPLLALNGGTFTASGALLLIDEGTVVGPLLAATGVVLDLTGSSLVLMAGSTLTTLPGAALVQLNGGSLVAESLVAGSGRGALHEIFLGSPALEVSGATVQLARLVTDNGDPIVLDVSGLGGAALIRAANNSTLTFTDPNLPLFQFSGSFGSVPGQLLQATNSTVSVAGPVLALDVASVDFSTTTSLIAASGSTLAALDALIRITGSGVLSTTNDVPIIDLTGSQVLIGDGGAGRRALIAVAGVPEFLEAQVLSTGPVLQLQGLIVTDADTLVRIGGEGRVTGEVLRTVNATLDLTGKALVEMANGFLEGGSTLFQVNGGTVTAGALIDFVGGFSVVTLTGPALEINGGAVILGASRESTPTSALFATNDTGYSLNWQGLSQGDALVRVANGVFETRVPGPMFQFDGLDNAIAGGLLLATNSTVQSVEEVVRIGAFDFVTFESAVIRSVGGTLARTTEGPLLVVDGGFLGMLGDVPVLDLSGTLLAGIGSHSLILVTGGPDARLEVDGRVLALGLVSSLDLCPEGCRPEAALIYIESGTLEMSLEGTGPVVQLTGPAAAPPTLRADAVVGTNPDIGSATLAGPLLDVTGVDLVLRALITGDPGDVGVFTAGPLVQLHDGASLTLGPLTLDGEGEPLDLGVVPSMLATVDGASVGAAARVHLRNLRLSVEPMSESPVSLIAVASAADLRGGLLAVERSVLVVDGDGVRITAPVSQTSTDAPLVGLTETSVETGGDLIHILDTTVALSGGLLSAEATVVPGTDDDAACDTCAIRSAGTVRLDNALLEATKPVIALIGASLRSDGDAVRIQNGAGITMPEGADGGVVSLRGASRMLVRDGNLVTATGPGSMLLADRLLVMDGGAGLEIRNGLLLDVANGASVVLRNCIACFSNSNNSLIVRNDIPSTGLLSGVPIATSGTLNFPGGYDPFPGRGIDNTISVTDTSGTPSSPGGAAGSLLRVGAGSTLTIAPPSP